jgi:hypothetical protein
VQRLVGVDRGPLSQRGKYLPKEDDSVIEAQQRGGSRDPDEGSEHPAGLANPAVEEQPDEQDERRHL